MTNTYARCKGCLRRRTPDFPVSATGLCIDCREARQIEYVRKLADAQREQLKLKAAPGFVVLETGESTTIIDGH